MEGAEQAQALDEAFLQDLGELEDDHEDQKQSEEADAAPDQSEPESVVSVARSSRINDALSQVEKHGEGGGTGALDDDDPLYRLIVDCNQLVVEIDSELSDVHNFLKDRYRRKFPELESLVQHSVDYARVVKAIGNQTDLTQVNLDGVLPSATIMVVTVTGSTSTGTQLSADELDRCLRACDLALELNDAKCKLLRFIEAQMARVAPNLCAITGSEIAAKLMATAGGLHALAKTPGCNIQVIGVKRKHLAGFSTQSAQQSGNLHAGYLFNTQLIQHETPPALRKAALRMMAGKVALMARKDAFGHDPQGSTGQQLKQEMCNKIEKWQEPAPARIVQPMKKPEDNNRTRRGGKRKRKQKDMLEMTEVRKQANRVGFNQPEEDIGQEEGTMDFDCPFQLFRACLFGESVSLSCSTLHRSWRGHGSTRKRRWYIRTCPSASTKKQSVTASFEAQSAATQYYWQPEQRCISEWHSVEPFLYSCTGHRTRGPELKGSIPRDR